LIPHEIAAAARWFIAFNHTGISTAPGTGRIRPPGLFLGFPAFNILKSHPLKPAGKGD
jgi:hypothetical protein